MTERKDPAQCANVTDYVASRVEAGADPRVLETELLSALCVLCKSTKREQADIKRKLSSIWRIVR